MFAGGEPTHMPEIKSIIQKIIDSDQSDVQINFTSNCSFQDPMWYNITESLPNVHWTMSIDAVGRDAELIRHGTDWTTVGKNVRWLAQHATSIDIHSVITNLNILRLKPLLRFVRELQESSKPPTGRNGIDGARHLITVITDKHSSSMAANNWPDSMRPQVIDYITDCIATIDLQTYQKDQLTYLRDLVKDTPFNPKLWDSTNNFHHSLNIVRKENHEFLYQPAI